MQVIQREGAKTTLSPFLEVKDKKLSVQDIVADKQFQTRLGGVNPETREQYADRMKDGEEFPPVVVFEVGSEMYMVDGFHRLAAAKDAGLKEVLAEVHKGTWQEAMDYALYVANRKNGQRLSRADLAEIVELTLKDPRYSSLSDRQIGKVCGCSHTTVGRARKTHGVVATERTTSDGRVWKVEEKGTIIPKLHLGPPPPGPEEIPDDFGRSALGVKVTERLQDHLLALDTTLSRMQFAGVGISEELKPEVEGQVKAIAKRLKSILEQAA